MHRWLAFPFPDAQYDYAGPALREHWARLHAGDAVPFPENEAVQQAWRCFHAGEFEQAVRAGLAAGPAGLTVANKAQAVYATYLEPNEKHKLALLLEVAERAQAQCAGQPDDAGAHFWLGYALGRYAQGLNLLRAAEQGLGPRVREALEATLRLAPAHADARIALAALQAELVDKTGPLLGKMQGASKASAVALFEAALQLNPTSVIGRIEYGIGLMMLEGEEALDAAERLYHDAAACRPADATERLAVEAAISLLDV
ncbi:hypothetical protein [Caldimonas brevitalea]|uniref:Tetratricopeptide repeat family protein n=1 Tax=Caldimonas brevitalea TaxID=413882 RepID=A0A0G3BPJ4_9BURK|nr:hypothetical protein [Caldimonas brevitalea]AKJ31354.1 tetratricopeptide repeat family protein [Caldimonas brevitalea]